MTPRWSAAPWLTVPVPSSISNSVCFPLGPKPTLLLPNSNEGLDIGPLQAMHIVTSSNLATCGLLRHAFLTPTESTRLSVLDATHNAQLGFLLAELRLAWTFCQLARRSPGNRCSPRLIRNARKALTTALKFFSPVDASSQQRKEIAAAIHNLKLALIDLTPRLAAGPIP